MNIFPLWACSKWWTEFPPSSLEYRKRLSDFKAMCRQNGLPVILCKNNEPVEVVFITEESIPDKRNQSDRIVCAWCGTEKGAWERFYAGLGPEPPQASLVRVVSPRHVVSCHAGCVDTEGCVWAPCPHLRIWKTVEKATKKTGGGRMIVREVNYGTVSV